MTAKPGRRRLDPDDTSVLVTFRITSKVLEQTQEAADRVRLSHAEWLRAVVTYAANPHAKPPR